MERVLNWLNNNQKKLTNGVIAVFVCILAFLLINTQIIAKREERYLQQMREFKTQAERASSYADSLQTQVVIHMNEARIAQSRAATAEARARRSKNTTNGLLEGLDSLREAVTDSIQMARLIIPKQDSIITQQQVTISNQDIQISFLNIALVAKDTALMLSTQRGDSLQRVVNNIPTPPAPPLFPKITRKQAFISGIVGGILLKVFVF